MQIHLTHNKNKILIVDDNLGLIYALNKMLENKYNVTTVSNGETAILKVKHYKYDLIIMDIHLGAGLNGIESTKIIKKLKGYENIPVIAMTAYEIDFIHGISDNELFCAYLTKPFDFDELKIAINDNLVPRDEQTKAMNDMTC